MPSAANQSIVERDQDLIGLGTLLDPECCSEALVRCGIAVEGLLEIDYLRYKPGRRCISLVRTGISGSPQRLVLSAFSAPAFLKQHARNLDAQVQMKSLLDPARQIRIDRFPFDPGLRHIEKCFGSNQRSRLMRRLLGRKAPYKQICLETLAYKPDRRFVAAGSIADSLTSSASSVPHYTFKFYSRSHFGKTLRRLEAIQAAYSDVPQIAVTHERYNLIAIEWIEGDLLADLLASGRSLGSVLFEVGVELARLHSIPTLEIPCEAATAHGLEDIAAYIGFISPELSQLAIDTVNATIASLCNSREQRATIHGDFYAKQVLVNSGKTSFIDFDQAGVGHPYQDVGNFVAKLYWQHLVLDQPLSKVEPIAESFLSGYRSRTRSFDESTYHAHLSAALIRCATHPFRRAMPNWPDVTRHLLALARHRLPSLQSLQSSVAIT